MSEYTDSVKEALRLIRKSVDALKDRNPDVATERSFLVGRLEDHGQAGPDQEARSGQEKRQGDA